jgi:ABC-type polysaccharide/polyol phosphate transport system ATPase subunit
MDELLAQAHTMLVVSHSLGTIRELCTDVIWLDQGKLKLFGEPEEVIAAYNGDTGVNPDAATTLEDF